MDWYSSGSLRDRSTDIGKRYLFSCLRFFNSLTDTIRIPQLQQRAADHAAVFFRMHIYNQILFLRRCFVSVI